ncbi:lipid asymmetry maintenance protein MlaB [Thalassotalea euphylliae]|uniref:STAS domain-containing protein n=1 Tax=Thalassotalea euphylliae TaxID=1655234 RepID=UPI0036413345
MQVRTYSSGNQQVTLGLSGSLLFSDYEAFTDCYKYIDNAKSAHVDLSQIDDIDVSGIAMLLLLKEFATEHRCQITFNNAHSEEVRRLFDIAGLGKQLNLSYGLKH